MTRSAPRPAQGRRIHVPRAEHLKPNRDFLAERYALFPPRELIGCILVWTLTRKPLAA
jgi:hypothetical protein